MYPCYKDICCQHPNALAPQQFCRDGRFPTDREGGVETLKTHSFQLSLDETPEFTENTLLAKVAGAPAASVTPSPLG